MASYETARNLSVEVGGINFAYRKVGPAHGIVSSAIPLVLLMHFRYGLPFLSPFLIATSHTT